ncbi:hypothetical protein [Desulfomonile tiedjei]|uniref:hypothetical protein n=1 Tax=Desulfomonile tiedjei TaxID=2358 RepID=UPI00030A0E75|nr:hypothetical protein [Desulfomonile tiedjei]
MQAIYGYILVLIAAIIIVSLLMVVQRNAKGDFSGMNQQNTVRRFVVSDYRGLA